MAGVTSRGPNPLGATTAIWRPGSCPSGIGAFDIRDAAMNVRRSRSGCGLIVAARADAISIMANFHLPLPGVLASRAANDPVCSAATRLDKRMFMATVGRLHEVQLNSVDQVAAGRRQQAPPPRHAGSRVERELSTVPKLTAAMQPTSSTARTGSLYVCRSGWRRSGSARRRLGVPITNLELVQGDDQFASGTSPCDVIRRPGDDGDGGYEQQLPGRCPARSIAEQRRPDGRTFRRAPADGGSLSSLLPSPYRAAGR